MYLSLILAMCSVYSKLRMSLLVFWLILNSTNNVLSSYLQEFNTSVALLLLILLQLLVLLSVRLFCIRISVIRQ